MKWKAFVDLLWWVDGEPGLDLLVVQTAIQHAAKNEDFEDHICGG
jgi:hypothetical protein